MCDWLSKVVREVMTGRGQAKSFSAKSLLGGLFLAFLSISIFVDCLVCAGSGHDVGNCLC